MQKIKYWVYEDEKIEVLANQTDDLYIKDKSKNKYFYKNGKKIADMEQLTLKIGDFIFPFLIMCSILSYLICVKCYFSATYSNIGNVMQRIIQSLLFLVLNVVLHELGHMLTMKYYGRTIGRVRFHMNFIFPTVSVATSDSYMLPRFRRLYVYANGLVVNIFLMLIVTLFYSKYMYLNSCILINVFMNALPIGVIKSDGYHILFNILLNKNDYVNKKNRFFGFMQIIFVVVCISMLVLTLKGLL